MGSKDDANGLAPPEAVRRPWSAPRVILSELRSTRHGVGLTPLDKIDFNTDKKTPTGSVGS
jgi:hypothetical protein